MWIPRTQEGSDRKIGAYREVEKTELNAEKERAVRTFSLAHSLWCEKRICRDTVKVIDFRGLQGETHPWGKAVDDP